MPPPGLRAAHRVGGPTIRWWTRAVVLGRAGIPGSGGVLLAANHRSFLDHYLLAAASPRPMWYLGKKELATGVPGWVNTHMGMVPVDRGRADLPAVERIVELLRTGEVVGVFPEGTRSIDGRLYRFRSGLGRIAAAAGVPVVPAGLVGTAQVWPPRTRPPLRRPPPDMLEVRFGSVLPAPPDDGPARRDFTARVRADVAALCEQPLADCFAPIPRP